MSVQNISPEMKLSMGRLYARNKVPYFTHIIMAMIPKEKPGLGTVGISEHMILYWDPAFVDTLTVEEMGWVLVHEVGHVIMGHARRQRAGGYNHMLFNVAGDMEWNDDIREMGGTLPKDCVYPETFGLKANGVAEVYYHELEKQAKKVNKTCGHGVGKGRCGSGAGNPLDGEDPSDAKEGRSEADIQRAKNQTAEAIRDHAKKGIGNVPGSWLLWAEDLVKPPKIPWNKKLARSIRGAIANVSGMSDYSYCRPSRRQAAVGFGNGKAILPTLRGPKPNIATIVDVSGSMGQDIMKAVSEVQGILRAAGTDINFIAVDCDIQTAKKISNIREVAQHLTGGGGTDFTKAIALAETKYKPSILVILTDGQVVVQDTKPKGIGHVIWVLIGAHRQKPLAVSGGNVNYGEFIEMDDEK